MVQALIQISGVLVILVALIDVFLTVLYSRADIPFLGHWMGQIVWRVGRGAFRPLGHFGDRLTTFLGPLILVLAVVQWVVLLVVGFALVYWPAIGDGIVRTGSSTASTAFHTALYYSGYTLTTLGYGDIVPRTAGWRVVTIVEAAMGFSNFTLTITYLLSVLSAINRRNVLALSLHHASGGSDDAAELLARLAAGASWSAARQRLAHFNSQLDDIYESHQSYPVLHYFYFTEPFFEMATIAGIVADAGVLARTALDPDAARQLAASAEAAEAVETSDYLLRRLGAIYLPRRWQPDRAGADEAARPCWRQQFADAVDRLAAAGLPVVADRSAAAQRYVDERARWQPWVDGFHALMGSRRVSLDG